MTDADRPAQAPPFHAVLTPHRSLGPKGFLILMCAFALVNFLTGIVFYRLGAWPVLGFCGLDVALLYLAFRLNYRSGRLYETVEITREALTLTRVHPSGRQERYDFNAYWARVLLDQRSDGRTDLRVAGEGREQAFARFLDDQERRELADALRLALLTARGGPRI